MINALIIEDRKKRSLILELNLKIYLEAKATVVSGLPQLKKIISSDSLPEWDIIICRNTIEGTDVFSLLTQRIPELGYSIPVLIQVDKGKKKKLKDVSKFIYVEENGLLKNILAPIAKHFEITPTQMASFKVPDPYPVDSSLIEYFISSPCDIYIDEEKEHCIIRSGELIDKTTLKELKGGSDLFIEASSRIHFVNTFTEQFNHMSSLLNNPDVDITQKLSALDKTLEFLSKEFQSGGMDEDVAKLSHQCISSMVEINSQTKGLEDLQKMLLSAHFGKRFLSAQLIIFYSLHMIKLLDWILEEPETNIPYAAFFHDILLEDDSWSVLRNAKQVNSFKLDELQIEKIDRHADLTGKFFESWGTIPTEASRLIREHHGSFDGRGFEKDRDKISNLSKTFLIAEEWAVLNLPFYQGKKDETQKSSNIKILKQKYEGKGYNELIGSLELLELVDLNKIVEYWENIDSVEKLKYSLEEKMIASNLFTQEQLDKWHITSFLHQRLEVVKEQGEHLLEEKQKDILTSCLQKSTYSYRILNGVFEGEKPPSEIEPEVLEQMEDCHFIYNENKANIYETIQSFRLSRDIKVTDLMLASGNGNFSMVKFLLEAELEDSDAFDLEGKTALLYAIINNHIDVVDYLLDNGDKIDQVDRMRRGPLYYSLIHGHEDLFFYLTTKGARPSQQAVGGVSLPMVCALKGHYKALVYLVDEAKADLNCQDANKKTIVDYAKKGGNEQIIEFIKNNI